MAITGTFSIGLRGLQVAQTAMEVVSHNIANVNTDGYSRQRLNLCTGLSVPSRVGPMGTGVDADNISRYYDQFIERSLTMKSSVLAKFEAQKTSLDAIENIFNESNGNGINEALSDFWNAWQNVANNPEGTPERLDLLEKAATVTSSINLMRADLDSVKADINTRLEEAILQVNTLTQEIADINAKIIQLESGGLHQANDLRDMRQQHIQELSKYMDINYFENPSTGAVTVVTPKGTPLVEEETSWSLKATADRTGDIHVIWERGNGGEVDITDTIENGRIGGWLELRDEIMGEFYEQFESFTQGLIEEVNRQHAQGVGLSKFTDLTSTYSISAYARLETDLEGDDNDIEFTALAPDQAGDQIRVEYVKAAGPNSPLSIVTNSDPLTGIQTITVVLATNSANQIATRAEDIVDAVNADAIAGTWVNARLAQGESGLGLVTEMTPSLNLNRQLDNLLPFGEDIQAGSFDVITYDSQGNPQFTTITVNPTDTREDIIAQINNIDHLSAAIQVDSGGNFIRIASDGGYEFALANDTSSALMALGLNTFFDGYNTRTIAVNGLLENDPSLIATGQVDAQGLIQAGDNVNALTIADLKDKKFLFQGQSETISGAYNSLVATVGAQTHTVTRSHDFNAALVDQIQANRDMVSAVSLDEEIADLMKFQYAYQAAAKIISATDEMLQTLLAMK